MADPLAVRVDRLSKTYPRGGKVGYPTLRDSIRHIFSRRTGDSHFWALRDVSFDVRRGEFVGILGRNGAGKSTLLRILARITEPTSGRVEYRGRVGSLLEVGAGFHGELTGRENIYLSGAILGMPKGEIRRRFDEIVAFSEIEAFLDTPVKHYSSGMYVRLAFAVAAHLEPSILLVDEALAVGDARFFTKSRERMLTLNKQGMTILLVTHNMWLVQNSCSRAICLEGGSLIGDGDPVHVIALYKDVNQGGRAPDAPQPGGAAGEIRSFSFAFGEDGAGQGGSGSSLRLQVSARVSGVAKARVFARVTSMDGLAYFSVRSDLVSVPEDGGLEAEATIERLMLLPGDYLLWVGICSEKEESEMLVAASSPLAVAGGDATRADGLYWNHAEWRVGPASGPAAAGSLLRPGTR